MAWDHTQVGSYLFMSPTLSPAGLTSTLEHCHTQHEDHTQVTYLCLQLRAFMSPQHRGQPQLLNIVTSMGSYTGNLFMSPNRGLPQLLNMVTSMKSYITYLCPQLRATSALEHCHQHRIIDRNLFMSPTKGYLNS